MARKKKEKIEVKSRAVLVKKNGMPSAEIDRLSTVGKKNKQTVFLTSDLEANNPETTIRVHRREGEAIGRFKRRFPGITPRLRRRWHNVYRSLSRQKVDLAICKSIKEENEDA